MPKIAHIPLITFIVLAFFSQLSAKAIDIVYPKSNPATINSPSTFFVGSTKPNASLTINDAPVKVYDNGSFVHVVQLSSSENIFSIKSRLNGENEELTFKIKKPAASKATYSSPEYKAFPPGEYKYSVVINDNSPIRSAPNDDSVRITHLSKDTILLLEGIKGNFYKINLGDKGSYWIDKKYVTTHFGINERVLSSICALKYSEDKDWQYLTLNLNILPAYKIQENGSNLDLTIYGINSSPQLEQSFKKQKVFESISIKECENNNLTLSIVSSEKLWGYDCYYQDSQLIFKKRKAPSINPKKPLQNIAIVLDAGHGGNDAGAIGPTRVKEKDINFDITKKLEKELKNAGAKVVLIREDDTNVDLYERVNVAKKSEALICLSIHANALPDSANPYIKHGTSTFYYYPQANNLALTLKTQLVNDLGMKDDGCKSASFVMTRITTPVSVLIETAYMINPEEYTLLLQDEFRQKVAESIKNGLETYLLHFSCRGSN